MKKLTKRILVCFMVFILGFYSCNKENDQQQLIYIKIAALLPQSGALSNLGTTSKIALEIGVQEINNDFISRELPYRINLSVFDTQLDTTLARSLVHSLLAEGYKMFIGPMSSAELNAIKSVSDSAGVIVVSPSSTSRSLSIANDAIFRYCPGEQAISNALAHTMYSSGKRAIVTVTRNDIATLGLQSTFTTLFSGLGGTVVSVGSYPINTTDFSFTISEVHNQLLTLSSTFNRNEIGVYYPSFNEAILFFNQAAQDSILYSVNWYGGVGFIKSPALLLDTLAAEFAYTTSYFSPETALPNSAQYLWSPLGTAIQNQCGITADFYAIASYDALHVMSRLIEAKEGHIVGGVDLQQDFYNLSNQSSGATGIITLDTSGDRSNGVFNYWGLTNVNGAYNWTIVGQSQ